MRIKKKTVALFTPPYTPVGWLLMSSLLAWLLVGNSFSLRSYADIAEQARPSAWPWRPQGHGAICIAASDDGPFFTLADLRHRPRPSQETLLSATIKPPPMMHYPPELQAIPIAPRSYTTETITYLAQHQVHYGDPQKPVVALTFDCEAGPHNTLRILKTLRQENVKATFFILGRFAYMSPDIVRQIADDGHELGNHSFFHPLFYDISPISITHEITATEAVVDWVVGRHVPMRYFRFPYAGGSDALRMLVASLGYQPAFWDLDPRGWEPDRSADDVVAYMRNAAHPGGIVILHCASQDDVGALPGLIEAIRDKGLEPGTLSDVLTEQDRHIPNYVPPGASPPPPRSP